MKLKKDIPTAYICSVCKISECQLWREYDNDVIKLRCYACSFGKFPGKNFYWNVHHTWRNVRKGDLVPAIPQENNPQLYCKCEDISDSGSNWWYSLNFSKQ